MRQVFVMLSKKKVMFVINMQKFFTSNIRHLQRKIITLVYIIQIRFFSELKEFFWSWVSEVFVILNKMKVIFVLYMQKFITSSTRYLFSKKNHNPTVHHYLLCMFHFLFTTSLRLSENLDKPHKNIPNISNNNNTSSLLH